MIATIIEELGPWSWWVLGMALLAAEIVVPGIFLIWIGLAALIVGAISLVWWESALWSWQIQFVTFAVLSVIAALAGRKAMAGRGGASDQPLLNRRTESLVGRTGTLAEPIVDGRGRLRIDDTWWVVSGPALPAGTRVRIVASQGRELTVGPLDTDGGSGRADP
jgi:inner membrane protein